MKLAKQLLHTYFQTQSYPFTRHHLDSFDQFMSEDMLNIIQSANPIIILKDLIPSKGIYKYRVEVYVGGETGTGIYVGSPTVSLQDSNEVRLLLPNEARLRNLTYGAQILADMFVRITIMLPQEGGALAPVKFERFFTKTDTEDMRIPLFKMPIMLHSRYCILHGKPASFLREAGECEYDYGGYFVVDGAEKILVTRQEQAFNTLYVSQQNNDDQVSVYATISCLSPKTRLVKRVSFALFRRSEAIQVSLPFVRKPIPLFIVFRALGIQSDYDIVRLIFPDETSAEAKLLEDKLHASIVEAAPFFDQHLAVQYIKILTKGFSEAHVLDILNNQTFTHIENRPGARAAFLADCVRNILRVYAKIDQSTNRDDTRNQRCLTSGFLIQMLFQGIYKLWKKQVSLAIDKEYNYNDKIYNNENFVNIFAPGNRQRIFAIGFMSDAIKRGFKGKWGATQGEEKAGALQSLSRLSYHDFLSHCRRAVLEFDTTLKITGPRKLAPSQYGYFCTSETPCGSSIGITKNLSMMTAISTATNPTAIVAWLFARGGVIPCDMITSDLLKLSVPFYLNGGILGYTTQPLLLTQVLRLFKRTGCISSSASIGFNYDTRRAFLYLDEGRPMRPLIPIDTKGIFPADKLRSLKTWRDLVMGTLPMTSNRKLESAGFLDPFAERVDVPKLDEYVNFLKDKTGAIEYVDPYEQNLSFIANFPEYITPETSHVEIHPSTILGLMTNMIPFANHNQSPRNQLSCSQSKQGLSIYSTKYRTRFDNQVHVLCYGEAPLCRTLYYDYVADGQIGYGHNLILAIGSFTGYNQDDGIVMNMDGIQRGMFRNMTFRSYSGFEEDDQKAKTRTRIANPARVPGWTQLAPGLDYSKLDDRGIIDLKKGQYVDQNTVIIGRYIQSQSGAMRDASITPQVWTSGRVDDIAVVVNNQGLRLVKIRIVEDRIPELGDKFSNRHGQKGTIGMFVRGHDMPRTRDGLVPDMLMNPHAIPSRMTIAQLLETMFGKAAAMVGGISNGTSFMNDGSPVDDIGNILETNGFEKYGNELLYDGTTGVQIPSQIFIGKCYTMRLKHMTKDKWNARAAGRREQRTHQPTGGRGNEGGLRIGTMETEGIMGHGASDFLQESMMKRSDGTKFTICNGCGTVPIYNPDTGFFFCTLCDGPPVFVGDSAKNLELLPPNKKSIATPGTIEIPYATYLLNQEMTTYMNMGIRLLTAQNLQHLRRPAVKDLYDEGLLVKANEELQQLMLPDTQVPEFVVEDESKIEANPEDLRNLGVAESLETREALADAAAAAVLGGEEEGAPKPTGPKTYTFAETLEHPEMKFKLNSNWRERLPPEVRERLGPTNSPPFMTNNTYRYVENVGNAPNAKPIGVDSVTGLPILGVDPNTGLPMLGRPTPAENEGQTGGGFAPPGYDAMTGLPVLSNTPAAVQPVAQQQVVTTTFVPPMGANIVPGAMSGAPPSIVVDTRPEAMRAAGFDPLPSNFSSAPRNRGGPRAPASMSGNEPVSSNARVTVIKQG